MGRLWIFERYFVRQILPWFGLATLGLILVFLTTQAVRVGPVFVGSGASFFEVLSVLGLVLVPVLGWAITPGFSVAVFAAVGRMAADGELTAYDSSGASRGKLWTGPFLLTLLLFFTSGWIWLDLAPRSQRVLRGAAMDLAGRAMLGRIKPGHFSTPVSGITFFSDTQAPDGTFGGVFIEDASGDENIIRLAAKEAKIVADTDSHSLKAHLRSGTGFITPLKSTPPASALTFETMELNIPLGPELNRTLDFLPVSLSSTTEELLRPPPSGQDPKRWSYRLWTRFAAPLGFLVIAILSTGFALSLAISRQGLAIAVSAGLFLTYHLLGRFFESLLDMDLLTPGLAAMAPSIAIAAAGCAIYFGRKALMRLN